MSIDLGLGASKYSRNAPASADIWAGRTAGAAPTWERNAKAPAAKTAWDTGVMFAVQNDLRTKGLMGVTAADYAAGTSGSVEIYRAKTAISGDKWGRKFGPYAAVIDRTVPTLAPRVPGRARENVMARVAPLAEALQAARIRGVAAGPLVGPPAPLAAPPIRRF